MQHLQRYGHVIGLHPAGIAEYESLHRAVWPAVLATIAAVNIRNYSIFRFGTTLFAYFEYVGNDFAADMAKMAADPQTQAWWELTAPLQIPLEPRGPDDWWAALPEVFHVD